MIFRFPPIPESRGFNELPYRMLVPEGVDNLLVAGRCIGGDKIPHASARNMMCCAVGGQGAGVAAALSSQSGQSFADLDVKRVQAELKRQGARIV